MREEIAALAAPLQHALVLLGRAAPSLSQQTSGVIVRQRLRKGLPSPTTMLMLAFLLGSGLYLGAMLVTAVFLAGRSKRLTHWALSAIAKRLPPGGLSPPAVAAAQAPEPEAQPEVADEPAPQWHAVPLME